MDKDFYKKEVNALQNLIEKLNHGQSEQATTPDTPKTNYDVIIVATVVFLVIAVSVGFLTYWMVH